LKIRDRFHALEHPFPLMIQFTSIVCDGVLEEFPKLKLAFLEERDDKVVLGELIRADCDRVAGRPEANFHCQSPRSRETHEQSSSSYSR
jgi:hypothetical protein